MGISLTTVQQIDHIQKNKINKIRPYQTSKPGTSTDYSIPERQETEPAQVQILSSELDEFNGSCKNFTRNNIFSLRTLTFGDKYISKMSNSLNITVENEPKAVTSVLPSSNIDKKENIATSSSDEDSISMEENDKCARFSDERRHVLKHYTKGPNKHKKVDSLYKYVLTKSLLQYDGSDINPIKNRTKNEINVKIEKGKSQSSVKKFVMELPINGEYVEEIPKLKVKHRKSQPKRHIKNLLTKEPKNNALDSNYKTSDYLSEIQLCNIKDINFDSQIINDSKNTMENQVFTGNFIEEGFVENDKDMLEKYGTYTTLATYDPNFKSVSDLSPPTRTDISNGSSTKINGMRSSLKSTRQPSPKKKKSSGVHFLDQKNSQKSKNFDRVFNSSLQKSSMTNDNYSPQNKNVYSNFTELHLIRMAQLENSDSGEIDYQSRDNLSRQQKNIDELEVKTIKNNLTQKKSFKKVNLLNMTTNQNTKKLYYSPKMRTLSINQKEDSIQHHLSSGNLQLDIKIANSGLITENTNYDDFEMANLSNAKHEFNMNKLKALDKCKEVIFKGQNSNQQAYLTYESLTKKSNLKIRKTNGFFMQDS